MKKSSKLACLFSLWLLGGLFTVVSLNITNGADAWIRMNLDTFTSLQNTAHRARLRMLYLWDWGRNENSSSNAAWMSAGQETLDVYNGLIVDRVVSDDNKWALVVVWWWQGNSIMWDSSKSGIAWWSGNKINWGYENAAIGGGLSNSILWNNGVVAWWNGNKWNVWWVVLWWKNNEAEGIVLWWQGNVAGKNGLAMWQWAKWWEWSFVRNDGSYVWEARSNSALIWAQRWVIISKGSVTPKTGVVLDVDWPVQIWSNASDLTAGTPWEIRSVNGCLYAHDWESWHILGKSSVNDCKVAGVAETCEFGRVLLQEWDKVMAYSERYSRNNCQSVEVTCKSWQLVAEWWATNYIYPSCFNLNEDPYYLPGN